MVNHDWSLLKKLYLRILFFNKVDTKISDEGAFHLSRFEMPVL